MIRSIIERTGVKIDVEDNGQVNDVRDELKEGQQILVKVINIDPTGKIRLSRKALLQDEAQKAGTPAPAAKE